MAEIVLSGVTKSFPAPSIPVASAPGLGAALSWLLLLVILVVTPLLFATGRFWVFCGSD